jgi:hypothetical protein
LPRPLIVLLLLFVLAWPALADRLRISPDDLRLRVAVSEELSPSLRREVRDLARTTPLPVENGLVQTEGLIEENFSGRGWKARRSTLVRYYFLVARLEQSQDFSDEFLRRRLLMRKGVTLLDAYIKTMNRMIARAVYTGAPDVAPELICSFPLETVEETEEGDLRVLHRLPAPNIELGRHNLRTLRELATEEREMLVQRLKMLDDAERVFLQEVTVLGRELLGMRETVRQWVREPGEGLPFSF